MTDREAILYTRRLAAHLRLTGLEPFVATTYGWVTLQVVPKRQAAQLVLHGHRSIGEDRGASDAVFGLVAGLWIGIAAE